MNMTSGAGKAEPGLEGSAGGDPPRACFRYKTLTIFGPWRRRRQAALDDAVRVGLAMRSEGKGSWRVAGEVEQSLCDEGGACGGIYPPK